MGRAIAALRATGPMQPELRQLPVRRAVWEENDMRVLISRRGHPPRDVVWFPLRVPGRVVF
jgi:hypothetical protein